MCAPEASWDKLLFFRSVNSFQTQLGILTPRSTDEACDFDIQESLDRWGNENNFPQANVLQNSKSHSWLSPPGTISFWHCGAESCA